MIRALTHADNNKLNTFEQWPSYLGKENWEDIVGFEDGPIKTSRLLRIQTLITEVILHELMHSIAVPNPTGIRPLLIYCVFILHLDTNDRI